MPSASENLAYLRACLRKRPFESQEEALSQPRAEDFVVYQCVFCGKWHRASRPHLKKGRLLNQKRRKQLKRIKALMRRDYFKGLKQWEDSEQTT